MKVYCKIFTILCMLIFVCPVYADSEVLCQQNEYVAKCSNYKLGTKWLSGKINGDSYNFYDYSGDSKRKNMKNLYIFFKKQQQLDSDMSYYGGSLPEGSWIKYRSQNNSTKCAIDSVGPCPDGCGSTCETYYDKATALLNALCNPRKGASVECEPCPNGYTFGKSTVNYNNSEDSTDATYWDINTIADCHLSTFVDETGIYEFQDETLQGEERYTCLYGDEVLGDTPPAVEANDGNLIIITPITIGSFHLP